MHGFTSKGEFLKKFLLWKMEEDSKIEQEQEILLYCLILELMEKWEDGLKLLEGPLGQKLGRTLYTVQ